jgi:predicted AlkP superfamily phosphohydrolase/phosphomutase
VTGSPGRFSGLLWVIWDGASFDVVQALLDAGDLPALRAVTGGRVLPVEPLSPSCQTPPSLASLFTGGTILEHGVTGFAMPDRAPGATFVDVRSGFERAAVRRPLIWEDLAARGVRVGLSHVPWTAAGTTPAPERTIAIHAYERCLEPPRVVRLGADGPGLDGPLAVRECDDGYEVTAGETGERVLVHPASTLRLAGPPLRLGPGRATRVAALARPDGARLLVHTGLWDLRAEPAGLQGRLDAAVGAFAGKTLGDAYHDGDLGLRAMEGGDGAAEDALEESARAEVECFTRGAELLLREGWPDGLLVSYLPTIDEAQHELFRWWDSGEEPAARAREALRRAYGLADRHLARLLTGAGAACAVVVSSDHGAGALRRRCHPNETLARAGLTGLDERGRIDVRASRAAYHPAGNGSVWVNVAGRPGGLVAGESRGAVAEAAERALRAVRDPLTGGAPFDVRRVDEAERDALGDLLLGLRPGYEWTWRQAPDGSELSDTPKGGTHGTPTGESTLRGILAVGDGRVAAGLDGRLTLMDAHAVVRGLAAPARAR